MVLYQGRAADTDASMMTKETVDARFASNSIKLSDVDAAVAAQVAELTTKAYVDAQDLAMTSKTYVDTQDNLLTNLTARGAALGVASLGADGKIPASQLYALPDRKPMFIGGPIVTSGSPWTITTNSVRIAYLVIPDPGWPYRVIPFASVENRSPSSGASIGRVIAVMRSRSNQRVGHGTGSATADWNRIKVLPSANSGENGTQAGFTGSDYLDLYAERQSGGVGHIHTSYALQFNAVIVPVI